MTLKRQFAKTSRRSFLAGTGAAVAAVAFSSSKALAEEEKKLNLYNYDTYIGAKTLPSFQETTGIAAHLDLFADMDELFAKLKGGNPGYDAIVVSSDYVQRMSKADMLIPIDHAKIPNMANIDPVFLDAPFDPGRKYSIPYMWGTIGIGYSKSATAGMDMTSWKILFESDQLAGKISLLGDPQYALGAGLKYLGYSYNSNKPEEFKKVEDMLIKQKKNIKVFAPDNGQDLLAAGEVVACMEWNGDIAQVMREDANLNYNVPKEGGTIWQDTWAIPKGAQHPENALAFLNFILDAKQGAEIANTIQFATCNLAAKKLMPEAYLKNQAIYPPEEVLAKCEYLTYQGEELVKLRDETWTRILAA